MKLVAVFALAALFLICAAKDLLNLDDSLDDQWEDFKTLHNKQYDEDEIERRIIWERNLKFIRDHNIKADMQIYSYHLGMNQFGDMTQDEINSIMLYRPQPHHNNNINNKRAINYFKSDKDESLPNDVNWLERGHVTDVRDQGYNNASWAFAAVGAIEGVLFRMIQRLIKLSEQQLIDCTHHNLYIWPTSIAAIDYVRKYGIQTEKTYPYTGIKGKCSYNNHLIAARTGHCVTISQPIEYYLKYVVAKVGPVSVAIDASQTTFHFYKHGVYDDKNCTSTHHNHDALVVGYTQEYFLVKNSWGPSWGHDGYIKIATDNDNQCGIASRVLYPYHRK